MKKLPTIITAACLAAFFAGCGDSNKADDKPSIKDTLKAAKAAKNAVEKGTGVKVTGNAVTDYKAALDKLVTTIPAYIAAGKKLEDKKPSLSNATAHMEAMVQWQMLTSQLAEAWKKATPAEREKLQAHADAVLEKMEEDSDERNALFGILFAISMTSMNE